MNKITKLALAGVVGSSLIFGATGCSSDSTTATEKAGCKAEGKCKGTGKCKADAKCKAEGKAKTASDAK